MKTETQTRIKFWKMNGAGNDFIVINNIEEKLPKAAWADLAKSLCERHLSIGADGLMIVEKPSGDADFRMIFFNADGSQGEMCGNGARCICRYGYETGLAGEGQTVETTAGIVTGERIANRRYKIRLNDPSLVRLDQTLTIEGKEYVYDYVELGNPGLPHAVVHIPGLGQMVDKTKTQGEAQSQIQRLFELGFAMRHHRAFPKGANVNFYDITGDDSIYIKTFERGVEDFTYACGTGTGSTALVLAMKGQVKGQQVTATMAGGQLVVDVEFDRDGVTGLFLTGPTNIVAKGEITDEELDI